MGLCVGLKNFLLFFQNRQFIFESKIQYKLVADLPRRQAGRSEVAVSILKFPTWCRGSGSNRRPLRLQRNALPTESRCQPR